MSEAHRTQIATQTITQMTTQRDTQTRLKERGVCSSKNQINKVLTRIGYMLDDLWGYAELDELGITQDVFLMYERLSQIQEVMNQESMGDNRHGR